MIFENLKNNSDFLKFEKSKDELRFTDKLWFVIADQNFFISNISKEFERVYLKLPDAIATVGGFMSLITPLIDMLVQFYVDNQYQLFLYKKIFRLEIVKEEENIVEKKSFNLVESMNMTRSNDLSYVELGLNISNKASVYSPKKIQDSKRASVNQQFNKPTTVTTVARNLNNENNNSQVINKDLNLMINIKNKRAEQVDISYCEKFHFDYCLCSKVPKNKAKYELMCAADEELSKKIDIFELLKNIDQLRLLTKLLLNENQTFMIQNREIHHIENYADSKKKEIKDLTEEKIKSKKAKLIAYLRSIKNSQNEGSLIDKILYKYLDEDLKEGIEKEVFSEDRNY